MEKTVEKTAEKTAKKFTGTALQQMYKGVVVRIEEATDGSRITRTYSGDGKKVLSEAPAKKGDVNHLPKWNVGDTVQFDTEAELNDAKIKGLVK